MLLTNIKNCTRLSQINVHSVLKYKTRGVHNVPHQVNSCLCSNLFLRTKYQRFNVLLSSIRIHSTSSDQHRQKVVIETSEVLRPDVGKLPKKIEAELDKLQLWKAKIDPYAKLARWDKPIGVYLLYWPCAWSIALGSIPGTVTLQHSIQMCALFFFGAVLMRGAGCTINDLWDKKVDAQVERTKNRPLVSGAVSTRQAVAFLGAQLTLALGVLMTLNCYSVLLGASSMLLVITYPLAKRFTNYPQLFLGATFNWGALLGYSAMQGHIDPGICIPLYVGSLAWTIIYDTIYAHQDKIDDARVGIKSTALTFGEHTKPMLYCTLALSVASLAHAGSLAGLGVPYYAALAGYTAHAHKQIYTLKMDNPDDCAAKFKSNSMIGLIIFLGIVGGGLNKYLENREKHRGKEDLSVLKSCVFS